MKKRKKEQLPWYDVPRRTEQPTGLARTRKGTFYPALGFFLSILSFSLLCFVFSLFFCALLRSSFLLYFYFLCRPDRVHMHHPELGLALESHVFFFFFCSCQIHTHVCGSSLPYIATPTYVLVFRSHLGAFGRCGIQGYFQGLHVKERKTESLINMADLV